MSKAREILRLKEQGLSHRQIAGALSVSAGLVGGIVSQARRKELTAGLAAELEDTALAEQLYEGEKKEPARCELPRPEALDQELRRPGVTLELLHLEYLKEHSEEQRKSYGYTSFCDHYRKWKQKQSPRMRQTHRAGEKLFVDYAGKKPRVVDRETGVIREVELFVATLGASNMTYVEATETQTLEDFTASHCRAFEFLGGVPEMLVPDQLKSGVSNASAYEPLINRSYAELARHYGCVVMPARPAKPRDKSKVEVAVQIAERWILARLRKEVFFSLGHLNQRIKELCKDLNERPMKKLLGATRQELFERLDRPALKALPEARYELSHWKAARVNIDYHVEYDKHYYSVPYQLLKEKVDIRATKGLVEIFHKSKRVSSHPRGLPLAGHTTHPEHMPKAHRAHLEWSPSRLINWALKIGPYTGSMVESILNNRPHPEMGYRSCLGILRLQKRYGNDRLEAACERALSVGALAFRPVSAILKNGLDRVKADEAEMATQIPEHANVRGPGYYH
jgi:transposase